LDEFELNRIAFKREEESLIDNYCGKFVAFCKGKFIVAFSNRKKMIEEAIKAEPDAHSYVRHVGQDIPSRPIGRH